MDLLDDIDEKINSPIYGLNPIIWGSVDLVFVLELYVSVQALPLLKCYKTQNSAHGCFRPRANLRDNFYTSLVELK